jgi:cation:H+ antiporter
MISNFLLLVIGLVMLVKGSDYFINAASRIAKRLGISEFVIGLTLVAVGTSLPELASSIFASLKHESGLIMGNIVGADIANLSLIVGIAAMKGAIRTDREMLERDGYFVLAVALLLMVFIFNRTISRIEGGFFIAVFIAYTIFLFETKPEYKGRFGFVKFTKYFIQFGYFGTLRGIIKGAPHLKEEGVPVHVSGSTVKDLGIIIISGALVIVGARFLVDNAIYFAQLFKVPAAVLGILIAIGTTLPELSVGISAARKGLGNIVIGNAIGSCVTNTLLILGVSSLIHPLQAGTISLKVTAPAFIFLVLLALVFIKSDWELRKREGIVLTIFYLCFIITMLIFGTSV